MRCLFIASQDPITPNFRGGGSSVYYDHFMSLCEQGYEVDLWHYSYPEKRIAFDAAIAAEPKRWWEIEQRCRSVTLSTFRPESSLWERLSNKASNRLFRQEVMNPRLRCQGGKLLKDQIRRTRPDCVWAEHFGPAQIAVLQRDVPVIYSHHDWLYRIKALAAKTPESTAMKASEEWTVRSAAAVVSGSAPDCDEIRRIGARYAEYIPIAYDPPPWSTRRADASAPRLIHLGGLSTTANSIGLTRFFDTVWPELDGLGVDMEVIGDINGSSPELQRHLSQVRTYGFVQDLSTVLRPFDLHIIPWEHTTGQRTRVVLAFGYGQVVVAVRAAVACFPEAVNGDNCVLVDRLTDMALVLRRLAMEPARRERLGNAARRTFEKCFTREALGSRFHNVIAAACKKTTSD